MAIYNPINRVNGTSGDDTLSFGTGNDQIYGLQGNDTFTVLAGGTGGTLYGGAGSDTFNIDHGDYTIYDFATGETLNVALGAIARLSGKSLDLSSDVTNLNQIYITGTAGADSITGSAGVDHIAGNAGNDTLSGNADDDSIDGGAGNDKLYGDSGYDTLVGGLGSDTLTGGSDDDDFIVDSGTDTITDLGEDGDYDGLEVSKGAVANVTVYDLDSHENGFINNGKVNLYLQAGAVVDLHAATGSVGYTITAHQSGSNITGSDFADTIIGGSGEDTIDGGDDDGGNDVLTGGLGVDHFSVHGGTVTITDFGKGGTDDLYVNGGATVKASVVADFSANSSTNNVDGTAILTLTTAATNVSLAGAVTTAGFQIYASKLASTITGSAGDDTITGGAGNDRLDGDDGDDSLQGGAGNDTIYGGDGHDFLNGGTGADTLIGGNGDDSYLVDNAGDRVVEGSGLDTGDDTIFSTISFNLTSVAGDVENLVLLGTGYNLATDQLGSSNINGTGNDLDNDIRGNGGNNILDGADGVDTLDGGAGNDTIYGGTGLDSLDGAAGNDLLVGGDGADIIYGGTGADSLMGGASADLFVFAAGDSGQATGFDKILDYAIDEDVIQYENDLTIGGADGPATSTQASIDQVTGVATFAAGSGIKMADALGDIAARFAAAGDTQGEFALFQLKSVGDYYLFISDGVKGVNANDVVVQLVGVTSFDGIDLTGGDLTLTSIAPV